MSIKIMSSVWETSQHSGSSLLVLLAIADYANDSGEAWPSVSSLALKARISERQTQRTIKELEKSGEIEVLQKSKPVKTCGGIQYTNQYRVVTSASPPMPKVVTSRVKGGDIAMSPNPSLEPSKESPASSKQPLGIGNPTPTPPLPDANQAAQQPPGAIQGCRHTAPGVRTAPALKETWLTAYAEEWEKATRGGAMPFRHAARALKEAEGRFGREAVLAGWARYCRRTEPQFLSTHSFVAKIGLWMDAGDLKNHEQKDDRYVTEHDVGKMVSSK